MGHYHTLSIILPCKNEGKSLSSILAQLKKLFADAEIIVVDDGSTDNTDEVCRSHDIKFVSNQIGRAHV